MSDTVTEEFPNAKFGIWSSFLEERVIKCPIKMFYEKNAYLLLCLYTYLEDILHNV